MAKPNIVFVHVDQMHHKAISAYGCKHVRTPAFDKIAGEGYSFMESYTPMPQCCPARASWFSGRMSTEHGVVVNGYPMDPNVPDLGQWLRKHGYETVHTGKWHVSGRDVARSFSKVLHRGSGHGELGDSAVARSAVAYLNNRTSDKPFFLSVGFLNPHDCCFPATSHGGPVKYCHGDTIKDDLPTLPGNFDHDYRKNGSSRTANWTLQDWRYYRYTYYRMVEMVDHEVGRVYDAVRNGPHADNTLFIVTSDHGDGAGFHAKVSKGYCEEEASRVPAIVSWPGKIASNVRDDEHLVSGIDLAATICDYAAAPPLPKMTVAKSWRPLLGGEKVKWRDYVVSETALGGMSICIREKRFKSIIHPDKMRLFDIENDPLETKDLADDPKYAAAVKHHRDLFRDYISSIELYRGPPDIDAQIAQQKKARVKRPPSQADFRQGNLYVSFSQWYEKVQAEI